GADSVAAEVAISNLAGARNRCALELRSVEGARLGPVRSLTLDAGETRSFSDLLAEVTKVYGPLEARAMVSCDGAFSTAAEIEDAARGTSDLVTPVAAEADLSS